MMNSKGALILGAIAGLLIPGLSVAADASATRTPLVKQTPIVVAQYDGPGYAGPYGEPGYGGPYDGYGPPRYRERYARPRAVQRVTYHGFRIELSSGSDTAENVAAVEHQIDIVDDVGLSVSNLQVFRSLPIRMEPQARNHYIGGSTVTLGNMSAADNRPVLLHEFMHLFNYKRMPGGFRNPEIRHFFEEARGQGLYPEGAYMLKNASEFFAVTASCYLYGTVARDPYNREAIRERQPEYYAFLEQLFGPPRGSHLSSDGADVLGIRRVLARPAMPSTLSAGGMQG